MYSSIYRRTEQITGWSNFMGQVTSPCSISYALAAMIVTAAEITNANYTAQTWHIYLVLLALLIVEGALTMDVTK
jgi:amino acid transporter